MSVIVPNGPANPNSNPAASPDNQAPVQAPAAIPGSPPEATWVHTEQDARQALEKAAPNPPVESPKPLFETKPEPAVVSPSVAPQRGTKP